MYPYTCGEMSTSAFKHKFIPFKMCYGYFYPENIRPILKMLLFTINSTESLSESFFLFNCKF